MAYVTVHGVLVVNVFGGASYFDLTDVTQRKHAYDLASGLRDDAPDVAQIILRILLNSEKAVVSV